ncbi:MAG: biopolymer transporter ExbD [Alphaproteobacteria bacterium]|nr:MAG: biopolymer transporter ExbD [Alphaproteobacteria bacterium]
MRKHGAKQMEEATIDLTPMLDVVFIMLIFFIVTATFVKESGIDVFKAENALAERAKRASILIAINENNQVYIQRNVVDVDAVRGVVERLYAENPKGEVVIQPDRNADITVYAKVQDQVKAAGVETIIMSTEPG